MLKAAILIGSDCAFFCVPLIGRANKEAADILNGNRTKSKRCLSAVCVLSCISTICFASARFMESEELNGLGEAIFPFAIITGLVFIVAAYRVINFKETLQFDETIELYSGEYRIRTRSAFSVIEANGRRIQVNLFPLRYSGAATIYIKVLNDALTRAAPQFYNAVLVGYKLHDSYKKPTLESLMGVISLLMLLYSPISLVRGSIYFISWLWGGAFAKLAGSSRGINKILGWVLFLLLVMAIISNWDTAIMQQ